MPNTDDSDIIEIPEEFVDGVETEEDFWAAMLKIDRWVATTAPIPRSIQDHGVADSLKRAITMNMVAGIVFRCTLAVMNRTQKPVDKQLLLGAIVYMSNQYLREACGYDQPHPTGEKKE